MKQKPIETTLYSLSDTAPAPVERRDDERHLTLFRVGALVVGGHRELCLIKNISAGGMLIRAYCAMAPGTSLSVELKRGEAICGKVSWERGGNVGVAFDAPIDVIGLLTPGNDSPRPRMPRIAIRCIASVRQGAVGRSLYTRDVSQGGIKVESLQPLVIGEDVVVILPGLQPEPGVVCWQDSGCYGISFHRLLALEELVAWLQKQREQMRLAS